MKCLKMLGLAAAVGTACAVAPEEASAGPALTIYNQDFAVVREGVRLELRKGTNEVRFADATAHLEPDSVILRDPKGKYSFTIHEQNYRNDPVSQELLLSLFEGKTIDFQIGNGPGAQIVAGRIVRSGYVPHWQAMRRYGGQYYQRQMAYAQGGSQQPIIDVAGKLRFGLPGIPLFPSLADDTILKPTLHWVIESRKGVRFDAELCYVTGGMSWEASYNAVAPEQGEVMDLVGWITMDNNCGKTFEDAKIKLLAGDVSKIQHGAAPGDRAFAYAREGAAAPAVTEKAFDEYHLYTLERRTTLRDREQKQVEFIHAENVKSRKLYIYDGAKIDWNRYRHWGQEQIRQDHNYGTQCNPKVWVMREFRNSKENGLGIPLPRGRVRFYLRDADGQLEFTGENVIDHTPKDEDVRVYTGNAFDVVGERRRTEYNIDTRGNWLDESFEIKLRNHKEEAVEVRVVEHLYRWINWEITEKSHTFLKTESQTMEFRVTVEPDAEEVVTYKVHYTW
jgi:hypothetical protein